MGELTLSVFWKPLMSDAPCFLFGLASDDSRSNAAVNSRVGTKARVFGMAPSDT